MKSDWKSMLYLSVKYELLPIKCTHFTIRREIQNVNFFQATPIFAWRQNFDYKILFHSYSTHSNYIQNDAIHMLLLNKEKELTTVLVMVTAVFFLPSTFTTLLRPAFFENCLLFHRLYTVIKYIRVLKHRRIIMGM